MKPYPTARRLALLAILFAGGVFVVQPGCSDESNDAPKIRSRKGTVKAIDLANRIVAMVSTDNSGNDITLEGTYTPETVIEINGRRADPKDVRVGDKVEVWGRKEGDGAEAKLVATKVVVSRAASTDWQSTGAAGGSATSGKSTADKSTSN